MHRRQSRRCPAGSSRLRRQALPAAALAALALAAPVAAKTPTVPSGSAMGDGLPLRAYASITPLVHLFGDSLTARVDVIADTKWVDPSRIRVTTEFRPYRPVRAGTVVRTGSGRFVEMRWQWSLRCLTAVCVPRTPPSDTVHVFHFQPARIEYLAPTGEPEYGLNAGFPPIEELSQLSPGSVTYLLSHKELLWRVDLAPVVAPHYRLTPNLLFWLAALLGAAFALLGGGIATRWALSFRPDHARSATASSLDRALALFFWARERGDDTLQRKALERVADELSVDDLSEEARALAWSPEQPDDHHVEEISERAHAGREDEP